MASRKSALTYKHFVEALKSVSKDGLPSIVYVYGPSDYLRVKVEEWYSNQTGNNSQVEKHYSESTSKADLDAILFQDSIFDPVSFHLIRNFEKKSEIQKSLSQIESTESVRNKILLVSNGKSILQGIQKDLSRLKIKTIPCFAPNHYELPKFLKSLAAKHSLKLQDDAVQAIIDSTGIDLFKLENEVKKFSLIFSDEHEKPISSEDLSPYLDCLRQEHAFKLEQLIMDGKAAHAQALLHDLLRRGQSHLALLGILSNHCRKALQIGQMFKTGKQIKEISQAIGLPFGVVKAFLPYVRKTPAQKFKSALILCQEADIIFKTSRIESEIIISDVIATIAHRT